MEILEKNLTRGGEFIIRETDCNDVFTPEDFTDEQKMMKDAVHDFIKKMDGEITIHKYIGEPEGSTARKGKVMNDWEGIILKFK